MTITPETLAAVAAIVQKSHPHLSHARATVAAQETVNAYLAKHQDANATVSVTWMADSTYRDLVADNVKAYAKTAPALFVKPPNPESVFAFRVEQIQKTGAKLSPVETLTLHRETLALSPEELLTYHDKIAASATQAKSQETTTTQAAQDAADLEAARKIVGDNASAVKKRGAFNSVSADRARRGRDTQAQANYAAKTNLSPADRLTAHRLSKGNGSA